MNGLKLKIIGAILSGVFLASLALIGWYADTQANINTEQNKQIEKKVDRIEYYQTVERIDKKLDKIIGWMMP